MTTLVIDASIAIKWVIEENGTPEALALRRKAKLTAPELLAAECANIFWKKVQRGELSRDEAHFAARLLQGSEVELISMRSLLETATRLAIELNHPAYDCIYIALAVASDCQFVTADGRLLRKLERSRQRTLRRSVVSLWDAAK